MLHDGRANRVAVVGGSRIPFCRSHSIYRNVPNQDMMTAALDGLVNKYDLKGQTMGDVVLGAVIKHSRDFNLARESLLSCPKLKKTHAVLKLPGLSCKSFGGGRHLIGGGCVLLGDIIQLMDRVIDLADA